MGRRVGLATTAVLFAAILISCSFDPPVCYATAGVHAAVGVCYGVVGDNLPSRADVVQLYKSSNIHSMRIYYPDPEALDALRGSGIGLILDVGGVDVVRGLASSASAAAAWVHANVLPYYPDVLFRYISVGNEVPARDAALILLPAMRNVRAALVSAGASNISVSTAVRMDVITDSFPPSRGVFSPTVERHMVPLARFLADTGSPLLANVYPYFAYRDSPRDITLGYATFRPGPGTTVRDDGNGLTYTNIFAAMVDAIHAALEKAGAPGVRVVVSESGWPSAGGFAATVDNARSYNQGLIDQAYRGTPKRPGVVLETYVFAMFNENLKPGDPTETNFGLFYPNKEPVYSISFPNY